MPKGFKAIQEAATKQTTNKTKNDWGPYYKKLVLPNDGSAATVRFLEQGEDVYGYWVHNFSKQDPANGWKTTFPCLDQDDNGAKCPGCEYDLHRTFRGLINVIWRNAPVYKTDDDGRLVKDSSGDYIQVDEKDQIAVWNQGIKVFTMLGNKDVAYKGLGSRDFVITRSGTRPDNTVYSVEAADVDGGPKALSDGDIALANDKYDLEELANFKSYDDALEIVENFFGDTDSSADSGDVSSFVGAGLNKNPFS
jgi:hypothetical protein